MEMLLKKEIGTAKVILGGIPFVTYPLASGPEGVTLEERKMAMAGTGGAVNEKGFMHTLLNDTNCLDGTSKIRGTWAAQNSSR
jgi:hypothetical protein